VSLFTVDVAKCKGDGICAAECPAKIIKMQKDKGYPVPVRGAEDLCIDCGHCVAVCPKGALSLKNLKPEDCLPVQSDLLPSPEQLSHFFAARRSIRSYKDKPVPRKVFSELISTANYAPSGSNKRPVQWLVIEDSKEVQRLAQITIDWMRYMIKEQPEQAKAARFDALVTLWENGQDRICRKAPHMVIAHAHKAYPSASSDCVVALTHLEQAAYSMGIGACWAGYFTSASIFYPPMKDALALPKGHQCFGALLIGYPKYRYQRIPLRSEPVVTWR